MGYSFRVSHYSTAQHVGLKPDSNPPMYIYTNTYSTQSSTVDKITNWVAPGDKSGEFKRQASSFRDCISDAPDAKFPAEKGRYHLYVSYACPWVRRTFTFTHCHTRTLIFSSSACPLALFRGVCVCGFFDGNTLSLAGIQ
jgi:hypothetical protein